MAYTARRIEKLELRAYIEAHWARNIGGAFLLGKSLVTWTSKKQNCISQSIVEAKYVVVAINCTNIVWIK